MRVDSNIQLLAKKYGSDKAIAKHIKVDNPLVSVIIPTYNCLEFLPRAIQSIQAQKVNDLEIIILDDNSSDNTWAYLTLACLCDARIRPIKLNGVGVAEARNVGIRSALGQLVAFLDADDYWLDNKLAPQLNFHMQNPKATLSFSNYRHVDINNKDLGDCFGYWPRFAKFVKSKIKPNSKKYQSHKKLNIGTIFAENVIGTSTVMVNKAKLQQALYFDNKLGSAEDWDLWLRAAKLGPIGFTPQIKMIYLMRQNSESSKTQLRLKFIATIFKRHYKTVLAHSPFAVSSCLSGLLTGYAEFHREKLLESAWLQRKIASLKSCTLHFCAFLLSPSIRRLKATAADARQFLLNI